MLEKKGFIIGAWLSSLLIVVLEFFYMRKRFIMGLLRNAIFRHPERSEGSYQRRDSSAFGLRMTTEIEFRNSPIIDAFFVLFFLILLTYGYFKLINKK